MMTTTGGIIVTYDILDHIPMGACVLRKDYVVLFWNTTLEMWTDIPRTQIMGTDIRQAFPHLQEPKFRTRFQSIFEGGPPAIFSSLLHTHVIPSVLRDGSLRLQDTTVTSLPTSDGHGFHALLSMQDVTDPTRRIREYRQMRDQALQEVEERKQLQQELDNVFNLSLELLCIADTDGYFKRVNPAFEDTLGYTQQDLLAQPFIEFVHPDDRADTLAEVEKLAEGVPTISFENRYRHKDGTYRWLEWSAHPEGDVLYGAARNITERKRAEARLEEYHRMQRLDSLGALAGGVAHDMNNVLASVMMTLEWLGMTASDDIRKLVTMLEASVQYGAKLLHQLLTFARGVQDELTPLQLRFPILQLEEILPHTLPASVEIDLDVTKELWLVLGEANQLHQVVINLSLNAAEAMPEGGLLRIEAKNRTIDRPDLGHRRKIPAGRYVVLSVSDTGAGMPPEVLEKIFDPFYSTKETNVGLGLSTSLGIIKSHSGFVDVESKPGAGTRFEIYLPALEAAPEQARPEQEAPLAVEQGQGELVLFVEDSDVHRVVSQEILEAYGYQVLTAADGAEALVLFEVHSVEIEAVVTDLMMPEMDGFALIRALRAGKGDLPVIAMSGLKTPEDVEAETGSSVAGFLSKPFKAEALLATLDEVLRGRVPTQPPQ